MTEKKETIMVVDDEATVRQLLRTILEEDGYQVITAANGEEALYKLSLGQAKIMLMDINMPVLTGMEVLRKLSDEWFNYCIIMVTAIVDMNTAVEALRLGAYDYITKPFDFEDVRDKLASAISRYKALGQEKTSLQERQEHFSSHLAHLHKQFSEMASSLSKEHALIMQIAIKQGEAGKPIIEKLPRELQQPITSAKEFKEILLKLIKQG